MHVRSGRQKPHAGGRTPVTVWTPGSIGHVVREHSSLVTERTLIPNRYTTFVLVPPVTAGPWPLHVTEKVTFWPRTAGSGDMVTFVTGQSALEDEQLDHVIEANAGVHTTSMHTTRTAERDMVPEQERALEVDGYCGALQLRRSCAQLSSRLRILAIVSHGQIPAPSH